MTTNNPNITRLEFVQEHDGVPVHVRICPISWKHDDYGMQTFVSLKPEPKHFELERIHWRTRFSNSSDADVAAHVAEWLKGKTGEQLRASFAAKAKGHADLLAQHERSQQKRHAAVKRRDARFKTQGMTHKIRGWIHGNHGDDLEVSIYLKCQPTKDQAQQLMRKRGCKTGNDFVIEAL